jgi:fructokinase
MNFDVVSYGEALWDILPSGPVLGGAPLNFTFRMEALGRRCGVVSSLGRDELGDRAVQRISELGVETRFLQRNSEVPTGTVAIDYDSRGNPDFTINSPAAYDHIEISEELTTLASQADCLCFGSLVQRSPRSRETLETLIEAFQGQFCLYDINLRKGCYTEEIVRSSLGKANVLKLSEEEVAFVSRITSLPEDDLLRFARGVIERMALDYCVITLGPNGALAVSATGERAYGPAYAVEFVEPVGAGDAFSAGFIHALMENRSLADACTLGNALGSLVAGQRGATQPIDEGTVESLLARNRYLTVDRRFAGML